MCVLLACVPLLVAQMALAQAQTTSPTPLPLAAPREVATAQVAIDTAADDIRRAARAAGADVGVAMRTLDGALAFSIDGDVVFHAASTMKVAVMVELFRQADAGRVSLDDTLIVTETFRSIVDGSPFTLAAADDSDKGLYAALGTRRSLRDLCESMIVISSNLATNMLIEHLGVESVRATVTRLGADGVEVHRGVEDTKAFQAGRNNTTTASGLQTLLTAIANGRAGTAPATAAMIAMLSRQQFNEGIPAGLPAGVAVAHKTGQITRIHHDAAIVYGSRPYVLIVLVRGLDDKKASAALIAEISRRVWEAVSQAALSRRESRG